jgi:hypothetical protein
VFFGHLSFENQIAEPSERIPKFTRRCLHAYPETTIMAFPTAIRVAQKGGLRPLHFDQQFSLKVLVVSVSHTLFGCITVSVGSGSWSRHRYPSHA